MYSRSFQPPKTTHYGDIPVQSFEDSFSADAFLKEAEAVKKTLPERKEPENTENEPTVKSPRTVHPDDLLLLALLVLFLSDRQRNNDKLLPVLLAVLLLS